MPYVSTSFCSGNLWKSSTEPSDEREVEEADPVGESFGEPASELGDVDGTESTVIWRLRGDL